MNRFSFVLCRFSLLLVLPACFAIAANAQQIKVFRDHSATNLQTARDLYNNGDYSGAFDAVNAGLQDHPDSASGYYLRTMICFQLKDTATALGDLNKVISLDPENANAYNFRGLIESGRKQYKEAFADFSKAIELNSDLAEAYSNRGFLKAKIKDDDGAMKDFDAAVDLDSNLAEPYFGRAILEEKDENYDDAIDDYSAAVENNNDYSMAYFLAGKLEIKMNRIDTGLMDIHWASLEDNEEAIKYLDSIKKYEKLELKANLEVKGGECHIVYHVKNKTSDSIYFLDMAISDEVSDSGEMDFHLGYDMVIYDSSSGELKKMDKDDNYLSGEYTCNPGGQLAGPVALTARDTASHIILIKPGATYTSTLKMYGMCCNSKKNPKVEDLVTYKYYGKDADKKNVKFRLWYNNVDVENPLLYGKKIWIGLLEAPIFTEENAVK